MSWEWREEYLDQILVPIGVFIMVIYHLYLWYTYRKFPLTTEMGCEDHYKRTWVEKTLQLQPKDVGPPAAVINSNIIASTSMASVSLVLSSLLGAWIGISSSETNNVLSRSVIYGDTRATTTSIKYIALLLSFLAAFAAFVQTTRNYTLAAFLISMPTSGIHVSYIQKPIIRGGNFWAIGIRALHFAAILIMWIFGPIPMFVSAVVMVAVLYNVDITSTPPYQFQPHLRHHQLYSPKNDEELE